MGPRFLKLGPEPTTVSMSPTANVEVEDGDQGTFYRIAATDLDGKPVIVSGGGALIESLRKAFGKRKSAATVSIRKIVSDDAPTVFQIEIVG